MEKSENPVVEEIKTTEDKTAAPAKQETKEDTKE